jgi:hypothetical protein
MELLKRECGLCFGFLEHCGKRYTFKRLSDAAGC